MTIKDIMDIISVLFAVEVSVFAKVIIFVVVAIPTTIKFMDMYYEMRIKREKYREAKKKEK